MPPECARAYRCVISGPRRQGWSEREGRLEGKTEARRPLAALGDDGARADLTFTTTLDGDVKQLHWSTVRPTKIEAVAAVLAQWARFNLPHTSRP